MFKHNQGLILLLLGILFITSGCIRTSITDQRIIDDIQAFLDAGPDQSDKWALTVEERAVIESFEIYRNTVKVQLVQDTDQSFWEPIAKKFTHKFAYACRAVDFLQASYYGEVYIMKLDDEKLKKFMIVKATFSNSSERILIEEFSPVRGRR